MANEKIELDIIVNGKPARVELSKVEQKTESFGKTTKKVGKEADGVLTKMRAGWIAVGASVALAVSKASSFERASLGLTNAQKEWAKETALATDIQAEQVAGFLKSAQTAGLAEDAQKRLAKQAIALGYAFPHENAETLHDNLVMLAKTGEAQGFMVDILEQQYVGLGEEINTLDLKTKSWSEKMKIVNEVAKKSQEQMDGSSFNEYNEAVGRLNNGLTDLGESIMAFLTDSGLLGVLNTSLSVLSLGFKGLAQDAKNFATYLSDDKLARRSFLVTQIEFLEKAQKTLKETGAGWADELDKMFGTDTASKLIEFNTELQELDSTLGLLGSAEAPIEQQLESIHLMIKKLKNNELSDLFGTEEEKEKALAFYRQQLALLTPIPEIVKEQRTAWDKLQDGFSDYVTNVKKKSTTMRDIGLKTAQGMEDAFVNMAMGVKTSFKDMAKAVMADLIRLVIQRNITNKLFGLFHTGTAEVKHTGGAIGMAGIPSFHTGVRSDERIAKLQVGEAVINRGGATKNREAIEAMNKGYSVGGQGGGVTTAEINFNVQAIDASSFNSYLVNNRGTIEGIINSSLTSNGSVRRTIRQVV